MYLSSYDVLSCSSLTEPPHAHSDLPPYVDFRQLETYICYSVVSDPNKNASHSLVIHLSLHCSSEQSSGSNALTVALASSGAAVVVLGAAFAVFKYRQLKRSGEPLPFPVPWDIWDVAPAFRQRQQRLLAAVPACWGCSWRCCVQWLGA